MKDNVKIYYKLDKNYKNLLFLLFIKFHTLSTNTYYLKNQLLFYIINNIKKFTTFYYLYM